MNFPWFLNGSNPPNLETYQTMMVNRPFPICMSKKSFHSEDLLRFIKPLYIWIDILRPIYIFKLLQSQGEVKNLATFFQGC